jgi:hypothetical protein
MAFDVNNQYTGKMFGNDRWPGHTTPDLEASEPIRPWLPVPYPAPYLPALRQDAGHPKLASVVLSSQHLVGQDKSGALVPAGLFCGVTPGASNKYCILQYSSGLADEFTVDPRTGGPVTPGDHVLLAAPSDAAPGNITLPNGTVVVISQPDIDFAHACNLFPAVQSGTTPTGVAGAPVAYSFGVARPIGVAVRNVLQYIGGVKVLDTTLVGGILYRLEGMVPTGFQVNNYMHEMGTAIQTQYVLRVPWIGATPGTLQGFATTDNIRGYVQGYGRSFAHYTGAPQVGNGVTFSQQTGDCGNYSDFDATKNTPVDLIGRIIGVLNMIQKVGYSNRIKTLWDPSRMVGPTNNPNPASIMMGGSATGGIPYDLSLTTDGIYKASLIQKTAARPEYGTYVLVRVNL